MSSFDALPVILISAADEITAATLISELIDNDVTDDYLKDTQTTDRVWKLVNKYYTANVRVHLLTDHEELNLDMDTIEAHIIHITKEELSDESAAVARAQARVTSAAAAWRRSHVRLVTSDSAGEPGALRAWAAAARAELVALRGAAPDAGLPRARDALHAHVWRGLQRAGLPTEAAAGSSCSESDDEAAEDSDADELRAVEHAEAFAAALGALGPALAERAAPGALGPAPAALGPAPAALGPAPPSARLDRAEALVTAFCRALGYDLDAC